MPERKILIPVRGAIKSVEPAPLFGDKVKIITTPCCVCGLSKMFVVETDRYERWQLNESIQKVFPEMTKEDREILISGTHDECFHKLFPVEDE